MDLCCEGEGEVFDDLERGNERLEHVRIAEAIDAWLEVARELKLEGRAEVASEHDVVAPPVIEPRVTIGRSDSFCVDLGVIQSVDTEKTAQGDDSSHAGDVHGNHFFDILSGVKIVMR